ncbi:MULTISPECIES: biopolymer transporter ExbD [Chryseobacterium]|uniref:Biopolymer transport protein ExbD n=1 Tax=Chryseobacterium camelliae TaxID=1265445 RepID=A0ABU0TL78_9FLAO|nr:MULTISPECIES: biopolymer transporter ExbD [Chryseobacterium]MDT3408346.1 biopolymer transport protein ExbD [Pseudacidovorax intermedius]MDQ1097797.1 biopolymer transport protein ExbD [Chryseobacterium camelliae]MDQ1101729.1 biopolymer transport protein ExbD [Chryseobacterium sp. SORGH_AS_1048]MDR6085169.1 biopolymer transport protein ExbD [Chryseobacterium sp. SORGH_AS_0909]MDR6129527.1 biopolymer transport protein ExbD [Chryseobacterium sp. SORGH_AS_1175]
MAEIIAQDKQGGKQRKKLIRVDMTPMVDLGFLLITFFMFTTNFTKPNVMDLGLPAKDPDPYPKKNVVINDKNQVTFILGKDNKVFYHQSNSNDLNTGNLKETDFNGIHISKIISEAYDHAPNKDVFTIIIKPTDDANYKNFVDMLDNIAISKKEQYGVTDIKPWEKKVYEELTK